MNSIIVWVRGHKILGSLFAIIAVVVVYYGFFRKTAGQTQYVLAAVEKGTIVTSISGSGQVSALNQTDIKPKVSGTLTYIGVKAGQQVSAGQVLASVDSRDAQRAVRDAQIGLESAQIALEKMRHDQETGAVTTADDLTQSYKDAYSRVSDAFLDLPNIIELARGVLYDDTVSPIGGCSPNICEYVELTSQDFRSGFLPITARAESDYKLAKDVYDSNFAAYQNVRFDASPEEITAILKTAEKTAQILAQAVKSEQTMLDTLVTEIKYEADLKLRGGEVPQQVTTYQNNIDSAVSNLNSILLSLGNARRSIESAQTSLEDAALTNPTDIRSQENTVAQRQAALEDAQVNLSDYTVRASFSGVVANSDIKVGDSVSGSTIIATLLTKQSIAEISLNEIDVSKVEVGQKATLTFDAIDSLTIAGEVSEIDTLGTVSQGVVTYDVKIGFDTQDERVKPGMSVSAAIITDAKQDVLMVPNSAIKTTGGISYAEVPQDPTGLSANTAGVVLNPAPKQQSVEVGVANDSMTEITGGLKEGDLVVTRTITSSAATTPAPQTRSIFQTGTGRTGAVPGR